MNYQRIYDDINNLKKTCKYCKAKINPKNYGRWYGEKCKFKSN